MTNLIQRTEKVQVSPPTLSFEDWQKELQEKYDKLKTTVKEKLPDAWEPLEFTLSVLMILNIKNITLPFAGIILGNPSSSKTVGIEMLRSSSQTFYSDGFTPKSFVSHNTGVNKEKLPEIDLLPKIKEKLLLAPELSPIFTKKDEDLIELLGILTRILDGRGYESDSGSHGHRGYSGEYMFTMVGAAVDIPYKVHKVLGTLGPKLYFYRLDDKKKTHETYLSQLQNDTFRQDLEEVSTLLAEQLRMYLNCPLILLELERARKEAGENQKQKKKDEFKIPWDTSKDETEALNIIVRLGRLLSYLRGVIPTWETKDSQGIDYAYTIATKEEPDRAMIELRNLARGHALLEGRNYINLDDIPLLIKVVFSTASKERVKVFELLLENNGLLTTSQVEEGLNTSDKTAKRTMSEFKALGLVKLDVESKKVEGQDNLWYKTYTIELIPEFDWFLTEDFKKLRK